MTIVDNKLSESQGVIQLSDIQLSDHAAQRDEPRWRHPGRPVDCEASSQYHTCHILPPSEIYFGAVFGCVCRLRREIFISQNWLKG